MGKTSEIIAIVGPESTGKTTLADQLAEHFGGTVVPESAREFLTARGGHYQPNDLITIAENQLEIESRAIATSDDLIFCDTDIVVVLIWYQYKYGKRSAELEDLFNAQPERKYLLTYPDLPWRSDPLRENPNDQMEIFDLYERELKSRDLPYVIIRGKGPGRSDNAVAAVEGFRLLDTPSLRHSK